MAFLLPWLRRGFTSAHAERIFKDLLGYPDITNLEDRQVGAHSTTHFCL